MLAAAPLLSATSLAQLLDIVIKNAIRLLDGFVGLGVVSEVTRRADRSRGAGRADRGRHRPTLSSRKPARWRQS